MFISLLDTFKLFSDMLHHGWAFNQRLQLAQVAFQLNLLEALDFVHFTQDLHSKWDDFCVQFLQEVLWVLFEDLRLQSSDYFVMKHFLQLFLFQSYFDSDSSHIVDPVHCPLKFAQHFLLNRYFVFSALQVEVIEIGAFFDKAGLL